MGRRVVQGDLCRPCPSERGVGRCHALTVESPSIDLGSKMSPMVGPIGDPVQARHSVGPLGEYECEPFGSGPSVLFVICRIVGVQKTTRHASSAAGTYGVTLAATTGKGQAKAAGSPEAPPQRGARGQLLPGISRQMTSDLFIAAQDTALRSSRQSSAGNNCLGMP
jgi:hypothetical protein